ncbi:MAG: AtpZ/AtpI family protein [Chlorobi bacterium]|jgi:F0F1-type ATP synthase assembly protein I|nr:AtpZ/AtpI family protein [Chlorobiota bacterium]
MPKRRLHHTLIYFSSAGIEMAAIIGLFAYAGHRLDLHYGNETPWWTAFLSLAGVFLAIYRIIRQVNRWNRQNE